MTAAVREKPDVIGFLIVEPSPIPSEPPKADWDGEIHQTRAQADAECIRANNSGSEPDEKPDDWWRVVAVVEVDAEAEKRDRIAAALALHRRSEGGTCPSCAVLYPCQTAHALGVEAR